MRSWCRNIFTVVVTLASAVWVTLRIWIQTYGARRKTFTEHYEYPELPLVVAPRYRGFHRYDVTSCIACGACARDCPVDCIYIERERADGRKGFLATGFTIDFTKCLFCGLCVEACPTHCLLMGSSHDLSCYSRDGCIVDFCRLPLEIAWGQATLTPLAVAQSKALAKPVFTGVRSS
ncbi:MAG: 4Fe-4S binding protein [Pirellulales bacterium]|nr:4Fe-4S binding protein [Pirellulales bacterium]